MSKSVLELIMRLRRGRLTPMQLHRALSKAAVKGNKIQKRNKRKRDRVRRQGRMAKRRAAGPLPVPYPDANVRVAGMAGWKVLAARMESGAFYAFADMCALLPEYPRSSVKAYVFQRMPQKCVLSRVHAPEAGSTADVARVRRLADWRCDSGGGEGRYGFARQAVDSVWLYTLSEHGEREAAVWREKL